MSAAPKYNHIPKPYQSTNDDELKEENKKDVLQEAIAKLQELIKEPQNAQKAAQIIERMLNGR